MEGGKTGWQTEAGFGVALIPYMDLVSYRMANYQDWFLSSLA